MTKPAFLSQPTIQRIPPLLEEVRQRQIVVPKFQRPFVWSDEQRLELMRSINEGLPIGSLMVWRTSVSLATYRFPGSTEIPNKGSSESAVQQYLLDGHQRVTTLYFALRPPDHEDGQITTTALDEDYPAVSQIYYDLRDQDLRLGRRGAIPAYWLPIDLLFDPYNFFNFQKDLSDLKDARDLIGRAEQLVTRFKDYAIPIVPIATDSLETATKSFQRVNSAGTTMSEVHMVNALTYAQDLRIIDRIGAIKNSLEDSRWSDIEDQVVLNVCKAVLGIEFYARSIEPLVDKLTKRPETFDDVERALNDACRFLSEDCDIHGPQTLPYSYQLVIIASVLENIDHEPDEGLRADLYNWLWATTYAEYFAGTNSTRLRLAMEGLAAAVGGKADLLPDDLTREIDPPGRFDFRSARSRAIALGMADRRPLGVGGQPCDAHELLALHGRQATPKLLIDREVLRAVPRASAEGFENRFIVAPGKAKELRDLLLSASCDAEVAESHGIDRRARKLMQAGDWSGFLERRRALYLEHERSFAEGLGLRYHGAGRTDR